MPRNKIVSVVHVLGIVPLILVSLGAVWTIASPAGAIDFLAISSLMTDSASLLFTLMFACTPLTILFGWRWTQPLKKPLALYAFLYIAIHYLLFSSAFNFNVQTTLATSFASAMLLSGTLAFLIMIPLAITSNRTAMKWLGQSWKTLHKLTYPIALLIAIHVFFVGEGINLGLLYIALLTIRFPPIRSRIIAWRTGRPAQTFQVSETWKVSSS